MCRKVYKILILLSWSWCAACVKDKPIPAGNATPGATGNVYVICEGNYGNGDASLYAWQPSKDSVYGDLYSMANNQPLGNVFESMVHIGDKLFLCVNSSNKIVVLNANNRDLAGTITIPQPRYILPLSATRAYVSTLYSNLIYIINPQAMEVTGTISLPKQSAEGMCLYNNNNVFTGSWDSTGQKIFEINTATGQVTNSITVAGYAPQELLLDKNQMLWVLAGYEPERAGTLTRLDPSTGEILQSYHFPASAYPLKPVFNNTKDTLYFIEANYSGGTTNNGIYRMGINDAALPLAPFLQAEQYQYFYALGIDPLTGYVYVGDPKGFIQKGSVYILRPDGTKVTTFNVGVGPGHFYFDE